MSTGGQLPIGFHWRSFFPILDDPSWFLEGEEDCPNKCKIRTCMQGTMPLCKHKKILIQFKKINALLLAHLTFKYMHEQQYHKFSNISIGTKH